MPIYRVHVTERHRESVEELYVAYRDAYYDVVYEIEADDEEEAQENYYQGDRVYDEFSDYGDYYDSEFIETLDVTDSELEEEEIESVECVSDEPREQHQAPRIQPTQFAVPAYTWDPVLQRVVATSHIAPPPTAKPTWEI